MDSRYSHCIVLDFEATCDESKAFSPSEIIEFPLVVLSTDTLETVQEFHSYIKPTRNPTLTPFCTNLTGILQKTVDSAQPFEQVWENVLQFLTDLSTTTTSYNPLVITCGDWDLKSMLPLQLSLCGIKSVPAEFSQWCNIKHIYERAYGGKAMGMDNMLSKLNLPLVGRHHSGIDDARNIASIVKKVIRDGHVVDVTFKPRGVGKDAAAVKNGIFNSVSTPSSSSGMASTGRSWSSVASTNVTATSSETQSTSVSTSQPSASKPPSKQPNNNTPKKQPRKKEPAPEPPSYGSVVDIGANLTHKSLKSMIPDTLYRAAAVGVSHIILTGTSVKGSREAAALVRQWKGTKGVPDLSCTVGVHPHDAGRAVEEGEYVTELRRIVEENRDIVVAIGECGLDYDRMFSTVGDQDTLFKYQLELAQDFDLPLFLHTRSAHTRFENMLKEHAPRPARGVVHCYTDEHVDRMHEYVGLGLHIGFTGWICDSRPGRGDNMEDVVKAVPSDRYLVETDAPFLLPRNKPGKNSGTCEPHDIVWVVERLAEWRGTTPEGVAAETTANAEALFRFNKHSSS
ncbi:hypothetical protein SmJEL517_g03384 [Synchytrium microbalum]|uniref:Exonuclease domain-containing protein n=1 Tax=Synchytrium microbalum TaxID=1806994 RepID=A0A507C2F9_9FUNG|nr:uncharacterized protein SmJEL517_g03384 [Synchytrium microbalum]TPX33912.1 hypothetical protein SmJEL517_g03384 [Synchytrium microbalum]